MGDRRVMAIGEGTGDIWVTVTALRMGAPKGDRTPIGDKGAPIGEKGQRGDIHRSGDTHRGEGTPIEGTKRGHP